VKSKKDKRQQGSALLKIPNEFDRLEESVIDIDLDTKSRPTQRKLANDCSHGGIDKDSSQFGYLSTVVTECLDLHQRCTGFYTDNSEKYILRCSCLCHRGKDVENSPLETNPSPNSHERGVREGGGLR
jgi:hypothetical protein